MTLRDKILALMDLTLGTFDDVLKGMALDGIQNGAANEQIAAMVRDAVAGQKVPLPELVGIIKTTIEHNPQVFAEIDQATLPDDVKALMAVVKEKLSLHRTELEDSLVAVYRKHFAEAEIDEMLAFYQGAAAAKLRQHGADIGRDVLEAKSTWQFNALEAHRDEITSTVNVDAPPAVEAPVETPPAA